MHEGIWSYDVFIEDGQIRIVFEEADSTSEFYLEPEAARDLAGLLQEMADLAGE